MSLLTRAKARFKQAKPEMKNRLYRHRCGECGFLGALPRPDSSRALPDAAEVAEEHRQRWRHRLRTEKEGGNLNGSEYDPRMGQDIGYDAGTPFGVLCTLGQPQGPTYAQFQVPGRRETVEEFMRRVSPNAHIIREPDPSSPSPFGRMVGTVTTPVWPLVQPHACRRFMKYRAGLTPAEHKTRREWLFRWKLGAAVAVGVALLTALLKLMTG